VNVRLTDTAMLRRRIEGSTAIWIAVSCLCRPERIALVLIANGHAGELDPTDQHASSRP
jgi:hypothetical protein